MLKILKLIEMLSGNINTWSQKKIMLHRPISKYKMNIVNNFLSISAFIIFCVIAYSLYFPANIQDVETPEYEEEVIHVKIATPEQKEFERLQKHFIFLKDEVYDFIEKEVEGTPIDTALVLSFMQNESGGYCGGNWDCMVKAKSRAGARGVMQIMPFHAPNPDDLWNWKYNIKKGIWYLSACMEASGGNIRDAARRYNQGIHGNPRRYRNWKYVARIAKKYKKVLSEKVMVARK